MGESAVPYNILSDTYNLWVPIEDTDLMKSVEVDGNGDWIVKGVMTSDVKDEEDDTIAPEGMDCSYFLEKGWIKYEHGNNPNQFIGEPLAVKVGQFEHPTLKKSVNGIYVEGRLYHNRELARQAVKTIEDLQKSHTKRRMGWSIEGSVKERCRKTGKILKSVLRNVVLTMNPVNTMTWVELAKSFAKNHEVTIDMEPVDKSLDTEGMAEIMPQSLEGAKKTKDEESDEEVWKKLLRGFVDDHKPGGVLHKSVASTPGSLALEAFSYAKKNGTSYDDACEFAAYIKDRHEKIRLLIKSLGGDTMGKQRISVLDTELDELEKSLAAIADDEDEEELRKSQSSEDDEDGEDADDEDTYDDEDEDDEYEDDEGEGFAKSFGKNEKNRQAIEVSDFLGNLVDEIGFTMDGFNKSLGSVAKQQIATVNALKGLVTLTKSLAEKLEDVSEENADLRKSLDEILNRPVGRRGVTSTREVTTLTKGMGGSGKRIEGLTRTKVMEEMQKSLDAGNMAIGREIMRYEAGVPLDRLDLPKELREKFGLE